MQHQSGVRRPCRVTKEWLQDLNRKFTGSRTTVEQQDAANTNKERGDFTEYAQLGVGGKIFFARLHCLRCRRPCAARVEHATRPTTVVAC